MKVPREEQIITENTHEAIVSRELWDTVHQIMKGRRRENSRGEVQMFAGLVKCGGCGSSLNASYAKEKGSYTSFSCWVYKNYGKDRCTSHSIGWKTLCRLVLEDIRRNASAAELAKGKYIEMLTSESDKKRKREQEKLKRELKAIEKRLDEIQTVRTRLYEDMALGRLPENRYNDMTSGYDDEENRLKPRQEELSAALLKIEEVQSGIDNFLPLIKQYTDITELNTYILNELIEKIIIHEKEPMPDGTKSQRVDIYYRFIGYIHPEEMVSIGML